MTHTHNTMGFCSICRNDYTPYQVKIAPRTNIHVCPDCLEAAKHNFIWVCIECGKVYIVAKSAVLNRITDYQFKKAYTDCADLMIIKGIYMCAECDPEGVFEHLNIRKIGRSTDC